MVYLLTETSASVPKKKKMNRPKMKCCIYNRSLPKWILAACCYNKFWNIKVCHCTFSVLSVNRKLPPRLKTALRNSALNRHWSDICLHLVSLGSSKLQFELWVDPDTAGLICRYRISFLDCTHTSSFFFFFSYQFFISLKAILSMSRIALINTNFLVKVCCCVCWMNHSDMKTLKILWW